MNKRELKYDGTRLTNGHWITDRKAIIQNFKASELAEAQFFNDNRMYNLMPAEIQHPIVNTGIMITGQNSTITVLFDRVNDSFIPVNLAALPKEFKYKQLSFRLIGHYDGYASVAINSTPTLDDMDIMLMSLSYKTLDAYEAVLDGIREMYKGHPSTYGVSLQPENTNNGGEA